MISLEHLAADLHVCGYRSVEAALADGHRFAVLPQDVEMIDALLLKLWTADPASDQPIDRASL